jgi:hypothetical protein
MVLVAEQSHLEPIDRRGAIRGGQRRDRRRRPGMTLTLSGIEPAALALLDADEGQGRERSSSTG